MGEEELYSPAGNPHLPGGMLQHLQADLGDLTDDDLHQLMEDFCQEVALCELNAPPEALHQSLGANPIGNEDPNADDQEVTFLRGEGGFPQVNHSNLQSLHNQMGVGFPWHNLLSPQLPFNLVWTWGT